jgi:hypothetical protein
MSYLLSAVLSLAPATIMPNQPIPDGFQCAGCGQWHESLPLDLFIPLPDFVAAIDPAEREKRVVRHGDFIVVDDQHYFLRAVLELPIKGHDDTFAYGIWVSLSKKSYDRAREIYSDEKASDAEPAYFGWFMVTLPGWPKTLELKTQVKLRATLRAAVTLEPTEHPLAVAQRDGIELDRVKQIIATALHPDAAPATQPAKP